MNVSLSGTMGFLQGIWGCPVVTTVFCPIRVAHGHTPQHMVKPAVKEGGHPLKMVSHMYSGSWNDASQSCSRSFGSIIINL